MEQHPVPQHIASFQFKLFGNLTIRQFVTLAIPISIAGIIYFSNISAAIRLPLSVIITLSGLFIALVPIEGRPFDKWVVAFVKALLSPTQRIWIKEKSMPEFLAAVAKPRLASTVPPEPVTTQGKEKLKAYLQSLIQEEVSPLDVKERIALEKLNLSPLGKTEEGTLPPPIIWPEQKAEVDKSVAFSDSLPQIEPRAKAATQISKEGILPSAATKVASHAKPYILHGVKTKLQQPPRQKTAKTKAHLASDINFTTENIIPIKTPDKHIKFVHGVGKVRVRKLHFAPPPGFDLSKLPIRGERRFEVSEELKRRFHLDSDLLHNTLPTILQGEVGTGKKLKAQKVKRVPWLSSEQSMTTSSVASKLRPSQNTMVRFKKEPVGSKLTIGDRKQPDSTASISSLSQAQIVPLTNKPNVISGIVTGADGSPIAGAILIVRDENGIPVRALKSNKLGQFLSATPLPVGKYQIEIDSELASFEPVVIGLKNQVLKPLEIKAKEENRIVR